MRLGITMVIIKEGTKDQTPSKRESTQSCHRAGDCYFTQRQQQEAEESRRKGKANRSNDMSL